jgi:hypothetical protein
MRAASHRTLGARRAAGTPETTMQPSAGVHNARQRRVRAQNTDVRALRAVTSLITD